MRGYAHTRVLIYVLFATIVISSVIFAMPGAFIPQKNSIMTDAKGSPLPPSQYRLKIGDTAIVRGIQFSFARVDQDNRCPDNTQCVSYGHAIITLHVSSSATAEDVSVDTSSPTNFVPFTIRLVSLTPKPTEGDTTTEAVVEILDTGGGN